jgi:hypothetical protein
MPKAMTRPAMGNPPQKFEQQNFQTQSKDDNLRTFARNESRCQALAIAIAGF